MPLDLSAKQWEQVKDLFTAALEFQTGQRTAFLQRACGSDSAVRAEVERLLAEHEQASSFLAGPALNWAQTGGADLAFPAEMIGRTLSHYKIIERLGQGGMGVVYQARDLQLDRLVALKLLPGEMGADPERERKLVKEAKAASALDHPNIITIHETGAAEGVSFIVMEFVEGETLDRILARGRLPLAEAFKYGVQVADALSAAHAAGIVHLDLKPSNIMVRHDGWVKVLDFGLAKRRAPRSPDTNDMTGKEISKTEPAGIFGTASYMSPEQAEGKSVDSRSDIFSFATVLYEMIAGKKPFRGDTPMSTLAAILTQEPEPLSKIVDPVPAQLEAVLKRCFSKDPANRFPYAEDLKVALEELRQQYDSGLVARRAIAHHSAPRRFHTALWVLLAAGLLAAVGIWKWPASPPASQPLTEVPITFYPGLQINPSLSRDGAEVAFAWSKVGQTNFHIFIKTTIGPDEPLPLTRDPSPDLYPAVSPDGAQVAFLRFVGAGRGAVMLVSKFGKNERKIADVGTLAGARPGWTALLIGPLLSWSPDGKYIAASDQDRSGPMKIVLISVETGEKRRLTEPAPEDFPGDLEVSFSPDGRSLAFTRFLGLGQARLFRLDLTKDLRANGAPRLIRTGIPGNHSPSWTPDGRELLFAGGWQQRLGIWRMDASGRGSARQVPTPDLAAYWPVSKGRRLVFAKAEIETSNWELALGPSGLPVGKPTPIDRTTRQDNSLDYQPGGNRIAYLSDRGGQVEIWVADRDGSNARPLVSAAENPINGPKWSPDGKQILYIANRDGETHLYAIGADGGRPRRLTSRPAYAVTPQWSADGKWILYTEGRSGQPEIWKMKVEGGEPIQVTKNGGIAPKTSSDSAFIYYKKSMLSSEIWRLPVAGGAEERLFGTSGFILDFAVSEKGIYCGVNPILDEDSGSIQFFDLAARKLEEIYHTPKPVFIGLGISPGRRSLSYSQIERAESGLMRVEHFR